MQNIKPGLTTLSDALAIAFSDVAIMAKTEERLISDCFGAVLREDVVAGVAVPSVDNSAMDGYALRHSDLGSLDRSVPVVGVSLAGHPYAGTLPKGAAVRIATGAAIPEGADCVVIQENVTVNSDETVIVIKQDVLDRTAVYQNIRWAGEDIKTGDVVLRAGTVLRPQDIAVVAGQGRGTLKVAKPLRVAVFSTGDELSKPGDPLPPGGIYDSNRFAMIGMLRDIGCSVTDLGLLADDFDVLQNALASAAKDHDVLMTSGGVSVGKADVLKPVVEQLGEITAWKLAIKPGKPLMRGKIGDCLVIGLPGNPVSVLVSGLLYVAPLLRHAMGANHAQLEPTRMPVRAGFDFTRMTGRREWLRARLVQNDDGAFEAIAFASTSSGMLSSMVWADGLIELPENCGQVKRGDEVLYLPLRGLQ
ncbi:gephyrin-like molybdotransferase Glp [Thalassospira australica]|uniref:molybdopterin molybdotransferase MoeA n=1 Tax=Thalassospira australica TaxID=1528106 RepID=UPI00051A12E8|nr:gephyrin-like molybdotransferase Glp [Thalassospira australica]